MWQLVCYLDGSRNWKFCGCVMFVKLIEWITTLIFGLTPLSIATEFFFEISTILSVFGTVLLICRNTQLSQHQNNFIFTLLNKKINSQINQWQTHKFIYFKPNLEQLNKITKTYRNKMTKQIKPKQWKKKKKKNLKDAKRWHEGGAL